MSKKLTTPEPAQNTPEAKPLTTTPILESVKTEDTTPKQDSSSDGGITSDEVIVDEPKIEEGIPKADEPVAEAVFEPYELDIDEDSPISDEEFDEIVELADRLKLSKTEAQNLIKMRENSHEAAGQHFENLKKENLDNMRKAYSAEKDLHTKENKNYMKTAIAAFGNDPEFNELLKNPEMNFNIPLAKFLVKVGKKVLAVDTDLGKGGSVVLNGDQGEQVRNTTASKFYKTM